MPILYSGICCVFPLVYLIAPKDFKIIWLSNQLSIPDKGYSRNLSVVYRVVYFTVELEISITQESLKNIQL
jgi:hypothetical protein